MSPAVRKQARVTSKGQVTVPIEVRRKLGIRAGDRIEFQEDSTGFRVRPVKNGSPFEQFRGIGNPGLPTGKKRLLRYLRKMRGE